MRGDPGPASSLATYPQPRALLHREREDLNQAGEGRDHRRVIAQPGADIGIHALGSGDRPDQLFDPAGQLADLGAEAIDLLQTNSPGC